MQFPGWDPVLFDLPIPGLPIDVRWYGLMYVVAFLCAQWIMVRLARRGFFSVPPQQAPDLILYTVVGVMLGGRLGYAMFYDQGLLNPVQFLQVWKGGLAFHGGLFGVVVATWLFARKAQLPWSRVMDTCALAVTPGIFAVRMANFINGELYGRVTEAGVGWAMRFPTDPVAMQQLRLSHDWTMRDRELCTQVAFDHRSWESVQDQLSQVDAYGRPIDWESVRPFLDWEAAQEFVPYRHPSQLYEGLSEGLLVGIALWLIYRTTRANPLRNGAYAALFLLGYAFARFGIEFVRQPDPQFGASGTVLFGMTMGQTLTCAMVVGAGLILLCSRQRDPLRVVAAPVTDDEKEQTQPKKAATKEVGSGRK